MKNKTGSNAPKMPTQPSMPKCKPPKDDWEIPKFMLNFKQIDVNQHLATNKDILTSVIETCKQFHSNCETCPYWLKNKFNCIWNAHKIIGKDVMAYWDDDEIEERIL